MNRKYFDIINIIRKNKNDNEILECLSNYHENDIADIIAQKKNIRSAWFSENGRDICISG